MTPKQSVLKKYPTAHKNTAGYIQVNDRRGDSAKVIGRSWEEAAQRLRSPSTTARREESK